MKTATLYITGMACGGCASSIQQALLGLTGVTQAEVSHVEAKAEVEYDPALVSEAQMLAVVEKAGYIAR